MNYAGVSNGYPWLVIGDFNVTRRCEETIGGNSRFTNAMDEFNSCLHNSELDDLNYSGIYYYWSNSRMLVVLIISRKLDCALVNHYWMISFPNCSTEFFTSWHF